MMHETQPKKYSANGTGKQDCSEKRTWFRKRNKSEGVPQSRGLSERVGAGSGVFCGVRADADARRADDQRSDGPDDSARHDDFQIASKGFRNVGRKNAFRTIRPE